MHVSAAAASTAAGVLPVFLIAYLLEVQRIRPTAEQVRRVRRRIPFGWLLWRAHRWVTLGVILGGGLIEVALLSVVNQGGIDGTAGTLLWTIACFWVTVPLSVITSTMWDPPTRD